MKQRGSNPPAQPAHDTPLRAEALQDASHGRQVPAAEIVRVDQKRVEIVEVAARLEEAVPDGSQLRVAPHERVAERVEEAYEGELDLGVRVVDGRVEEGRDPGPLRQHVPAPRVSVDERRGVGLIYEILQTSGEPFYPVEVLVRHPPGRVRDPRGVEQTMLPEER